MVRFLARGRKRKRDECDEIRKAPVCNFTKLSRYGMCRDVGEVNENIKLIQYNLQLLLRMSSAETEPDSDSEQLLELMTTVGKSRQDSVAVNIGHYRTISLKMVQMFAILRECLLAYRWGDAIRVMQTAVCHPIMRNGLTILRISLELFDKLFIPSEYDGGFLSKMLNNLNLISDIRSEQLPVEHFLLTVARLHENCDWASVQPKLKRALSFESKIRKGQKRRIRNEHDKVVENCLAAGYGAYISYINWCLAREDLNNFNPLRGSQVESLSLLEEKLRRKTEEAIQSFKDFDEQCKGKKISMDMFVIKYVELLEHQSKEKDGCLQEAENLLQRNAADNMMNPRAWFYLYDFYRRNSSFGVERCVRALQELCTLNPSDSLASELIKYSCIGKVLSGPGSNRIILLFDNLDSESRDVEMWGYLGRELVNRSAAAMSSSEDDDYISLAEAVRVCWIERNRYTWWPFSHFSLSELEDSNDIEPELTALKATVAHFLLGCRNDFTKSAAKILKKRNERPESYLLLKQAVILVSFSFQ